jgi:hypothetical protein
MYNVTENSTKHGTGTPHGHSTPHKFPTDGESLTDIFVGVVQELYPTGRAFYLQNNGNLNLLHQAINRSFIRVVEDARLTIEGVFPTSDEFGLLDAELWEFRLGLAINPALTLQERKEAILRKMAYPRNQKARQSKSFIETQLQLAGFNVFVHENTQPYRTPGDIVLLDLGITQHGGSTQHGSGTTHGSINFEVIANYPVIDESYSIGGNLWATFFIGGEILGEVANIPQSRRLEFKELVLKLKPAHTVAFTFINFI